MPTADDDSAGGVSICLSGGSLPLAWVFRETSMEDDPPATSSSSAEPSSIVKWMDELISPPVSLTYFLLAAFRAL